MRLRRELIAEMKEQTKELLKEVREHNRLYRTVRRSEVRAKEIGLDS